MAAAGSRAAQRKCPRTGWQACWRGLALPATRSSGGLDGTRVADHGGSRGADAAHLALRVRSPHPADPGTLWSLPPRPPRAGPGPCPSGIVAPPFGSLAPGRPRGTVSVCPRARPRGSANHLWTRESRPTDPEAVQASEAWPAPRGDMESNTRPIQSRNEHERSHCLRRVSAEATSSDTGSSRPGRSSPTAPHGGRAPGGVPPRRAARPPTTTVRISSRPPNRTEVGGPADVLPASQHGCHPVRGGCRGGPAGPRWRWFDPPPRGGSPPDPESTGRPGDHAPAAGSAGDGPRGRSAVGSLPQICPSGPAGFDAGGGLPYPRAPLRGPVLPSPRVTGGPVVTASGTAPRHAPPSPQPVRRHRISSVVAPASGGTRGSGAGSSAAQLPPTAFRSRDFPA